MTPKQRKIILAEFFNILVNDIDRISNKNVPISIYETMRCLEEPAIVAEILKRAISGVSKNKKEHEFLTEELSYQMCELLRGA